MGKLLKENSIKKRLLVGIIGLAVSVTVFCGIANAIILYQEAKSNVNKRLSESATAYCHSVENAITIYETKIEAIAQNTSITDESKTQEQRNEVMAALAKKSGFATLAVADANGHTSDGGEVSEREYYKQSMNGKTYISSTLVSSVTGKTVLIVSAKIDNGGYNGIVIATLDSSTFSEMIDDVAIGKSGYGFIVDKDGKVIAHKNRTTVADQVNYIELAKENKSYSSAATVIKNMIEGKSSTQNSRFNGKKTTVSYKQIPETDGWSIGIVARDSELMQGFYVSICFTAGLIILFSFISFIIAFRIAKPIVEPIVRLVNRIETLAEGDLHSEIPQFDTGDEIDRLAKSFTDTVSTLNRYISEITYILSSLEQGDCTVQTSQNYKGDFVQIQESLGKIISNLNSLFASFKETANQVASGADQVSGASQALASGATQQAAAVEELNASIADVAQQADNNAVNVRRASGYVDQAVAGVNESNKYMQNVNTAMGEINDASHKIADITKMVEDIATQTNLLSLNAAIEAAHAGDAGKGFAVVASEVRDLAEKSAEAARETAKLIRRSADAVTEGAKLAAEATHVLLKVTETAEQANQEIRQIETASAEQAITIEQINQGLAQVSAVVQNNAATAQESSASSEELAAQAQNMQSEIDKLKLR